MQLERLVLANFRNIAQADISPDPVFNIFWGENAQGKTNILESIYLLGTLKSFRSARNEDLVRKDQAQARVTARVEANAVHRSMEVLIAPEGKQPRVDGKLVRQASGFFGHLRPVVFAPEEVALLKGPPAGRRVLLDRALFQVEPGYLERAQEYDRILRQRNRLLKEQRPRLELQPWDEGLIRAGAILRRERALYVQRLLPHLQRAYGQICGDRETVELVYPGGETDLAVLEEKLAANLASQAAAERRTGTTLAGPHRDDPGFLLDGLPVRQFASQGQQRSIMLAFKTAQTIDLEQSLGESPLLLLDDLTGELDRRRQEFFFRFLLDRRGQVFMTTTDVQPLLDEGFRQARRFHIVAGRLDPD